LPRAKALTVAAAGDVTLELMDDTARRALPLSLPNVLTYARIAAVPAMVACLNLLEGDAARWWAFGIFVAAAITDWLDGYLARALGQQSTLGRMLDPIADKLIVGAALLMLVHDNTIDGPQIWAAVIILCREILVSGLREFLAELNVKVHVTELAKWKTTVQMVALAVLLAGPAADKVYPGFTSTGLAFLWLAAILTLWTGYDYLKAGIRHAMER
jgi:CDP-diacylglycerol--glycerol-3-phosphate 3-phosphatidyltransferase/cardiolipin synthase